MKSLPINFVPKGWGYESWIANNDQYCGKLLFFKKGKHCSWHYHEKKHETFYIQSGKLLVVFSEEDSLNDNNMVVICGEWPSGLPVTDYSSLIATWTAPSLVKSEKKAKVAILDPGDVFEVPVGLRHAMYGITDTEMFEFSTHHEDDDSFRVLKGD
jgi:quercetin dioxygenase-like cupin family protein